jgi:hypothetical protein
MSQIHSPQKPKRERKIVSQLHALLSSGKLSVVAFVSALFVGRRIKRLWFQSKKVWVLGFDDGTPISIEPLLTSRGCHGLAADVAADMRRPRIVK